jgi:hypothetical protein
LDAASAPILEEDEVEEEEPLQIKDDDGTIYEVPGHIENGSLLMWKAPETDIPQVHTDGKLTTWTRRETNYGLPIGTPVVDGKTGTINWEFRCQFQRAIYDLMQERWRARKCRWGPCSKYFVADKTARKYCSPECYEAKRIKQANDYYCRDGKAKRQASKAKQTGAHSRKS